MNSKSSHKLRDNTKNKEVNTKGCWFTKYQVYSSVKSSETCGNSNLRVSKMMLMVKVQSNDNMRNLPRHKLTKTHTNIYTYIYFFFKDKWPMMKVVSFKNELNRNIAFLVSP